MALRACPVAIGYISSHVLEGEKVVVICMITSDTHLSTGYLLIISVALAAPTKRNLLVPLFHVVPSYLAENHHSSFDLKGLQILGE